MSDLPVSVGYITVTAEGLVGLIDSDDVGNQPDQSIMVATVELRPSITGPIVAVDEVGVKPLIAVDTVEVLLDASGVLRPTDDPVGNVRLVAPMQKSISPSNWIWTATFIPAATQDWEQFEVSFSGSPGDTVDLGSVYSIGLAAGNVELLNMWFKQLAKVPEQIMVGALTYDGNKLETAEVLWPDGTVGLLTVDTWHAATEKAASWHITWGTVTYTQPAITFNGDGEPIDIPEIVVS